MPVERIHFWGISAVWLFYVLAGVAVAIFLAGVGLRVSAWLTGRSDNRPVRESGTRSLGRKAGRVSAGLRALALDGLLGRRIVSGDLWAGLMHAFLMWGFIGLFAGTVLATIDHWLVHFLIGNTYRIYSLCLELLGLILLAGVLIALARRYVMPVKRLENEPRDLWALVLLFISVISGFLVEGTRLAAEMPDWESYSFTGAGLAAWLPSGTGAEALYPYVWWFHAVVCLGLVAYFPYSKLFHSMAAPVNIYAATDVRRCTSGVGTADSATGGSGGDDGTGGLRFTLADLVGFSSCTRCGRCNEVCPSASAAEPFAPREFIAQADRFTRAGANPLARIPWFRDRLLDTRLAAPRISPEQIWFCTTCRACLEVCPVYVGAYDPIGRMRASEVEEGSRLSPMLMDALETLYRFDNPWEPTKRKRGDWWAGLSIPDPNGPGGATLAVTIPDLTEGATADLCYWVGCTTSFDTRAQKIARAFVKIMTHVEVSFATLGARETCCGDIARRVGEMGLFEEQVLKTETLFDKYGVHDVVTSSPHCFSLFKNEYSLCGATSDRTAGTRSASQTGAGFRVRHYTQVLGELLDQGRLRPRPLPGASELTVTYHDPCYLGRHNHVYEAPRRLLRSIPGLRLVEMAHHGPDSLCCGGGGGRMWQELEGEQKLGEIRAREAADAGAQTMVTACPYCLIMLEDAIKTAGLEERLEVVDLNEIVAESLGLSDDRD